MSYKYKSKKPRFSSHFVKNTKNGETPVDNEFYFCTTSFFREILIIFPLGLSLTHTLNPIILINLGVDAHE
jgi:hypothetical protein